MQEHGNQILAMAAANSVTSEEELLAHSIDLTDGLDDLDLLVDDEDLTEITDERFDHNYHKT